LSKAVLDHGAGIYAFFSRQEAVVV
jgi:hypothetical protein